ncbi:hypothetical protein [Mesorhizobium sp. 43Arga]
MSHKVPECFQPEEIEFLQRVFDRLRNLLPCGRGTLADEHLAASLIQMYQAGVRDEMKLVEFGQARLAYFTRQGAGTPLTDSSTTNTGSMGNISSGQ